MFYRDADVGEVLGHDPIKPGQPIILHVFVRKPFDDYVRQADAFLERLRASSVSLGAQGVNVRLESLQALLSGGVAFDTPEAAVLHGRRRRRTCRSRSTRTRRSAVAAGYSRGCSS